MFDSEAIGGMALGSLLCRSKTRRSEALNFRVYDAIIGDGITDDTARTI